MHHDVGRRVFLRLAMGALAAAASPAPDPGRTPGLRVDIGDIRLFVDFEGPKLAPEGAVMRERPSLLLLHGGPGGDHSLFRPVFSQLADICHVVYYDHRGQGRSDRSSPDKWNLAQWADDVVALCDVLGISRPIVLGHSFGGMVAQAYAVRHPTHPAKLILSSTHSAFRINRSAAKFAALGHPECGELLRAVWASEDGELMARYIGECIPQYNRHTPQDLRAVRRVIPSPEVTAHFYRPGGEAHTLDFLPQLHKVRCPVLILAGDADPITPVANAKEMAAALPAGLARLETIEGAGHRLFHEAEESYFTLLRGFIKA